MVQKLEEVPRECNFYALAAFCESGGQLLCMSGICASVANFRSLSGAEMLLSRFKAGLKAGITRGGLPFFLFSFSITMTSQPTSIGLD